MICLSHPSGSIRKKYPPFFGPDRRPAIPEILRLLMLSGLLLAQHCADLSQCLSLPPFCPTHFVGFAKGTGTPLCSILFPHIFLAQEWKDVLDGRLFEQHFLKTRRRLKILHPHVDNRLFLLSMLQGKFFTPSVESRFPNHLEHDQSIPWDFFSTEACSIK
jgi:hypothetical protein